ncbi:hypothetical protein R3P38DRAFT_544744 [Favolaschia claudopus]|uniref:Zn(2)-C6 fungal-type domain-containing protein n=1 Tax=Favolaschia claudopus TaxID=2862362 RepID=A0AAW0CHF1_9AGAR
MSESASPEVANNASPSIAISKPGKRKRTAMACKNCRRRKIRCITTDYLPENPCAYCTRKAIPCEYVAASEQVESDPDGESLDADLNDRVWTSPLTSDNFPSASSALNSASYPRRSTRRRNLPTHEASSQSPSQPRSTRSPSSSSSSSFKSRSSPHSQPRPSRRASAPTQLQILSSGAAPGPYDFLAPPYRPSPPIQPATPEPHSKHAWDVQMIHAMEYLCQRTVRQPSSSSDSTLQHNTEAESPMPFSAHAPPTTLSSHSLPFSVPPPENAAASPNAEYYASDFVGSGYMGGGMYEVDWPLGHEMQLDLKNYSTENSASVG